MRINATFLKFPPNLRRVKHDVIRFQRSAHFMTTELTWRYQTTFREAQGSACHGGRDRGSGDEGLEPDIGNESCGKTSRGGGCHLPVLLIYGLRTTRCKVRWLIFCTKSRGFLA